MLTDIEKRGSHAGDVAGEDINEGGIKSSREMWNMETW
jgi:hypothetical protein